MVRLKGSRNGRKSKNLDISIPYGAIKSFCFSFVIFFCKFISIPYGAIKSATSGAFNILLKQISIPYGAIKRVPTIIKKSEVNIFQFLMVRLKGKQQ